MGEKEWYARVYRGDAVPQLTVRAVVMGSILGFFLAFTNLYIGLKTGWYLGVAITAVLLSFSLWTALLRAGIAKTPMSILENNCMQSCASCAGYGTGSTIYHGGPRVPPVHDDHRRSARAQPAVVVGGALDAHPRRARRDAGDPDEAKHDQPRAPPVPRRDGGGGDASEPLQRGARRAEEGARALRRRRRGRARADPHGAPRLEDDATRRARLPKSTLLPDSSAIFDWLPKIHANGKAYPWSDWTMRFDHSFLVIGAGVIVGLRTSLSLVLGGVLLAFFLGPHAMESTWLNPAGDLIAAVTRPGGAWKQIGLWYGAPLMVSYGLA